MTQMTPPPPPGFTPQQPQPQPTGGSLGTSKLAIGALVCSLLICIPFVAPLAGIALAIAALIGISKSQGRLGGKGLAIVAIVLSIIVVGVDIGGMILIRQLPTYIFATPAKNFIQKLEANDMAGAKAVLTSAAAQKVTDEDLKAIKDWLNDNCGTLVDVKFDYDGTAYHQGLTPTSGAIQPGKMPNTLSGQQSMKDLPLVYKFSKGTYYGAASVSPIEPQGQVKSLSDVYKLDGFVIIHNGELKRFPAAK